MRREWVDREIKIVVDGVLHHLGRRAADTDLPVSPITLSGDGLGEDVEGEQSPAEEETVVPAPAPGPRRETRRQRKKKKAK
jgi:hypothetical protein